MRNKFDVYQDPNSKMDLFFNEKSGCLENESSSYLIKNDIIYFLKNVPDGQKEKTKIFNWLGPVYDFLIDTLVNMKYGKGAAHNSRTLVVEKLGIDNGDNVLEVAVGTGINFKTANKKAGYYGVDCSLGMLKRAASNLNKWEFENSLSLCFAENLPFKNDSFNKVINIFGLIYFSNLEKVLKEMIRVVKKNGVIMIVIKAEWENLMNENSRFFDKLVQTDKFFLLNKDVVGYRFIKKQ